MNLTFSICDIGNKKIRIQDFTQDGEEYIPEDLPESNYIVRYFNYRYKDTCTINILQYNSSSKNSTSSITYTDHSSYLDEAIISIPKDGHYTIYHIVLPTVEWLQDKINNPKFDLNIYSAIYVTDGQCIYKYRKTDEENWVLEECDELLVTQVNTNDTTISREQKEVFYFYDLYNCYLSLCNNIFNKSILRCPDKNQDLKTDRYNRDFIWSAINVIKFYTENNEYESAQLLIEKLDSCNGICKQQTRNGQVSKCGCS